MNKLQAELSKLTSNIDDSENGDQNVNDTEYNDEIDEDLMEKFDNDGSFDSDTLSMKMIRIQSNFKDSVQVSNDRDIMVNQVVSNKLKENDEKGG